MARAVRCIGFNVKYNIAIFDEAQRMTIKNIQNAGNVADISVFFYDDSQILGKREQGTSENFKKIPGKPCGNKSQRHVQKWQ